MFDIGWSEMLVVGAVALVVIGPKDLPAALRQAGKWMGAVRRMAADFQGQVNQAMRESELDELRREVQNLKSGVTEPIARNEAEMRAMVEAPVSLPPPETPVAPAASGEAEAKSEPAAKKPARPRAASARSKAAAPKTRKPTGTKS